MRIGFDAKWLHSGHPSGKVFTQNILPELLELSKEHTIVLFLKRRERQLPLPALPPGVEVVFVPGSPNLVVNALVMPWFVRRAKLDLLITMTFAAPFTGTRQMTVLFDIIFEDYPEYFGRRERIYFWFIKPLLRATDVVVTISEHCLRRMEHHGYVRANQRGHVLLLGVGDSFFQPPSDDKWLSDLRARWSLPDAYILYVGRVNIRKNIAGLIEAFASMKDERVGLVICGKRDHLAVDVERAALTFGVAKRVVWLGEVPLSDLPKLYRGALAFAYPSFEEGFGLPPLEAMASGVPVVTSAGSSLPEVCADAARYVDPSSTEEISVALSELVANPALRSSMSQRGLRRASELTWPRVGEQFRALVLSTTKAPIRT